MIYICRNWEVYTLAIDSGISAAFLHFIGLLYYLKNRFFKTIAILKISKKLLAMDHDIINVAAWPIIFQYMDQLNSIP